jgi:uncharacterized membrane-anchored protein YhcB (DUF1043 family)
MWHLAAIVDPTLIVGFMGALGTVISAYVLRNQQNLTREIRMDRQTLDKRILEVDKKIDVLEQIRADLRDLRDGLNDRGD